MEIAKVAKEKGIIIYTVGVGKKEGAYIKIRDNKGREELLKDKEGKVVKSRLDEVLLNKSPWRQEVRILLHTEFNGVWLIFIQTS